MGHQERNPAKPGDSLSKYARLLCEQRRLAYQAAPHDAEEHANIEQSVLAGGYAYRQIAELVQNAADAISEVGEGEGRIEIVVDTLGLWAANTGEPVDKSGVQALLNAHSSGKRKGQIGRFGLGFKSLLKLGGDIAVMSRTVSLNFEPEKCRSQIRALLGLPDRAPVPGMRLAKTTSWKDAIKSTPGADRFSWATTLIFAELKATGAREAVVAEMQKFPSEFLLFLPGDVELTLVSDGFERRLRRSTDETGAMVIEDLSHDGPEPQRWRVFQKQVAITDELALQDATDVHGRDTVPLIWAAPIGGAAVSAGRFFAFFPTTTETRTLGILNAPWKLNSDRTALIRGAWNSALMEAAAEFIIDNLEQLARDRDPGAVLDAYPRDLTSQTEPAATLVNAMWERLLKDAVLPNCDGELVSAGSLWRMPVDDPKIGVAWSRLVSQEACSTHLHPNCTNSRERIARLQQLSARLMDSPLTLAETGEENPGLARIDTGNWLEQTATGDPEDSVEVFDFVNQFVQSATVQSWSGVRDNLRIIPGADGNLLTAPEASLSETEEGPLRQVHPSLVADVGVRKILQKLFDLREDEETDWDRLLEAQLKDAHDASDMTNVWTLLRKMPSGVLDEVLDYHDIPVHSLAGWVEQDKCICPGDTLQNSDLDEAHDEAIPHLKKWIIDESFHESDSAILGKLGVRMVPLGDWDASFEAKENADRLSKVWLNAWESNWCSKYHEKLERRPEKHLLSPERYYMPRGWNLLLLTEGLARVRVSKMLLTTANDASSRELSPVTFCHRSRRKAWETCEYPHPLWSLMLEKGRLAIGDHEIGFDSLLVSKISALAPLLPETAPFAEAMDSLQQAGGDWRSAKKPEALWGDWLSIAARSSAAIEDLTKLWEYAAVDGISPDKVPGKDGPVDFLSVLVARSEPEAVTARKAGLHCYSLSRDAGALWVAQGAKWLDDNSKIEWSNDEANNEATLLTEFEPSLEEIIREDSKSRAAVRLVASLKRQILDQLHDIDWALDEDCLLLNETGWVDKAWTDKIAQLVEAGRAAGWIDAGDALGHVLASGVKARRRNVSNEPDLPARLLQAVGGPGVLLELLEVGAQKDLIGNDIRTAEVILTLLGPALFTEPSIRDALEVTGLQPPARWGGEAAAKFITDIGFPADFAVAPERRREPELIISGPQPLKPLHDYQEAVVSKVEALLADETLLKRRAVISLPTGAGKTRVAAETAVTRTLSADSKNRLVVWIAQTDELCEQAVQCFRELWVNLGPPGDNLRVVRLWGSQTNPMPADHGEATVVVASIQTLTSRMQSGEIDWLSYPGLVVIDECHHALAPSYTGVFRWLTPSKKDQVEPPVIGLSATPFRGRSDDETALLAKRFDGQLIPDEQANLFDELQSKGVLAQIRYNQLNINESFALTDEEERHFEKFKEFPQSALDRLGSNNKRNERIIKAMARSKERSVLVFATSVSHARRLAARLNILGVTASVISSETDRNSRRWFVKAFQSGDLQVLCNHSALTTGFDAPSTDLIVLARPVFSPALYMQMVGRGLRGPLNGGKETCRVLTVQDNLNLHSDQLAHHYFENHYVSPD